eukprot:TRINITY_DN11797_c0_g1_i4.p1 TRINITY_DN11797_c0_g1~~TRINITY_DN11797_c0_g1_i4.p1  ORF type:complete len:251 (+),score=26.28 TRINITY_DN11797_c0_g1_i4:76-828(+)
MSRPQIPVHVNFFNLKKHALEVQSFVRLLDIQVDLEELGDFCAHHLEGEVREDSTQEIMESLIGRCLIISPGVSRDDGLEPLQALLKAATATPTQSQRKAGRGKLWSAHVTPQDLRLILPSVPPSDQTYFGMQLFKGEPAHLAHAGGQFFVSDRTYRFGEYGKVLDVHHIFRSEECAQRFFEAGLSYLSESQVTNPTSTPDILRDVPNAHAFRLSRAKYHASGQEKLPRACRGWIFVWIEEHCCKVLCDL